MFFCCSCSLNSERSQTRKIISGIYIALCSGVPNYPDGNQSQISDNPGNKLLQIKSAQAVLGCPKDPHFHYRVRGRGYGWASNPWIITTQDFIEKATTVQDLLTQTQLTMPTNIFGDTIQAM